jgi:hypothetical protein
LREGGRLSEGGREGGKDGGFTKRESGSKNNNYNNKEKHEEKSSSISSNNGGYVALKKVFIFISSHTLSQKCSHTLSFPLPLLLRRKTCPHNDTLLLPISYLQSNHPHPSNSISTPNPISAHEGAGGGIGACDFW